jgi:hypothetical protein
MLLTFDTALLLPFLRMSRPTDSWITDLSDVLNATAVATSSTTPSTTTFTTGGEAAPFVAVGRRMTADPGGDSQGGPDGEYDGGAKRAHLFLFDSASQERNRTCLGLVGQENNRFCLRGATAHDPASGKWF